MRIHTYLLHFFSACMVLLLLSLVSSQTFAATTSLGGMNLDGYCNSIQAGGAVLSNNIWNCVSGTTINMTAACQWQYPNTNATASQDVANNPYSWTCYSNTGTPTTTPSPSPTVTPTANPTITPTTSPSAKLGGMNIDGYCESIHSPGTAINNGTWYCGNGSVQINMTSVCQWEYTATAYATQDTPGNPYSWSCYSGVATTTPTPTVTITQTPTPTQVVPTATPSPTPSPTQKGNYYMALGDSFAFGFHQAQFNQEEATNTYNPASFTDGYDADFFEKIQSVMSPTIEINYSCPGETTESFISGGCVGHTVSLPLHTNYPVSQSQLQAAVAYLRSNPSIVRTITIDIGVNDAINFANSCQQQSNPSTCYANGTSTVLTKVQQNYDTILNALQAAAPASEIIIVKFPNPVYYPGTDALVNGLNQIQDNEAFSRGLRIADTFSIFTSSTICQYTNFCATPSDFHPTALGYSAMATQIWNTSGY